MGREELVVREGGVVQADTGPEPLASPPMAECSLRDNFSLEAELESRGCQDPEAKEGIQG